MYSNYTVKVLLYNRPKTDYKYFSSLNNYRLAKICKPCGCTGHTPTYLTRFNKIATQGAPQMAVDKEANSLSSLLLLF